MGNQGHSRDEARARLRVHHLGRDWRRPRSPRLDQPPARLLAAGRAAAGAAAGASAGSGDGSLALETDRTSTPALAAALVGNYPPADQLSWDLFLGVAPPVDYHPIYHPFNWRGWVDWGQGALGDMGAHLIDHPFWSLKLGMPTVIETSSTPFNGACYPLGDDDVLRVPGARLDAAGEADVVRRRPDAAEAGRDRRREA